MSRFSIMLLLVVSAGCGRSYPGLVPIGGKVVCGQNPVNDVRVLFVADSTKGTNAPALLAATTADGSFSMKLTTGEVGGPPGHYLVTLKSTPGSAFEIPGKYESSLYTPLKVEVPKEGVTDLVITIDKE